MKNFSLFILVFTASFSSLLAQSLTQVVKGRVIDKITSQPLPGVSIVIANTSPLKGTTTDIDGYYRLTDVEIGRTEVQYSFVGYLPIQLKNLNLVSGKELILNIEMEEDLKQLDEVVIKSENKTRANNKMATVSARSFTVEETEKYAGSWGDPSRMATNFAGVVSAGDQRNDIIIRGNSPTGLLWRLEDNVIPNPNHFGALGSTGGPVSILNNNQLANSDFFTGAFPAEYGNALAGVFDLKMRDGNNENHEFLGQIGFNGIELGAEGPINKEKRSSYLGNYRYSTLAAMDAIGVDLGWGDAVPQYQDFSGKLNFPHKKGNTTIYGLGGTSSIKIHETEEDTTSYVQNGSDMIAVGVSHTQFTSPNSKLKVGLAFSGIRVRTNLDTVLLENNKILKSFYEERNEEYKYNLNVKYVNRLDIKNSLEIGASLENYNLNYNDRVFDRNYNMFISTLKSKEENIPLIQSYTQWRHKFNTRWQTYTGIHYQQFILNQKYAIEPRAGIEYQPSPSMTISAGYGEHSQLQPLLYYYIKTYDGIGNYSETNKDLDFSKSRQAVISFNYNFHTNFRFKAETYYQYLYNIPVNTYPSYFSMINEGASFHLDRIDSLTNKGTGENYGVEFTLEKFISNNYYFLLTSSIFDSKYKGSDNISRNTAYNLGYIVNALAGYEFKLKKNKSIDINMRVVNAGGKRNLEVDLERSRAEGELVWDKNKAYSFQEKPYFRTDLRIAYKMNSKKFTQEWAMDITNLTNHKNVFMRIYDQETENIKFLYQQGLFPMFLYRINF